MKLPRKELPDQKQTIGQVVPAMKLPRKELPDQKQTIRQVVPL
jgi:hypothetical protein